MYRRGVVSVLHLTSDEDAGSWNETGERRIGSDSHKHRHSTYVPNPPGCALVCGEERKPAIWLAEEGFSQVADKSQDRMGKLRYIQQILDRSTTLYTPVCRLANNAILDRRIYATTTIIYTVKLRFIHHDLDSRTSLYTPDSRWTIYCTLNTSYSSLLNYANTRFYTGKLRYILDSS